MADPLRASEKEEIPGGEACGKGGLLKTEIRNFHRKGNERKNKEGGGLN